MIFMRDSRDNSVESDTNEHLKRSWDDQMNTTSVTIQSVKNRV